MAEVLYKYLSSDSKGGNSLFCIRWLEKNECDIFNEHLDLCGQAAISATLWDEIYDEGTIYAGLFVNDKMVARACVEKYSDDCWEVGDVRVAVPYRNQGYAHAICAYVLNYIVLQMKKPTMRTEESNVIMQHVIEDLGFTSCGIIQ